MKIKSEKLYNGKLKELTEVNRKRQKPMYLYSLKY